MRHACFLAAVAELSVILLARHLKFRKEKKNHVKGINTIVEINRTTTDEDLQKTEFLWLCTLPSTT